MVRDDKIGLADLVSVGILWCCCHDVLSCLLLDGPGVACKEQTAKVEKNERAVGEETNPRQVAHNVKNMQSVLFSGVNNGTTKLSAKKFLLENLSAMSAVASW